MSESHRAEPTVFYARVYDRALAKKIYRITYESDQTLNEVLERALAFAVAHQRFSVPVREDSGRQAREKRRLHYKKKLAGL